MKRRRKKRKRRKENEPLPHELILLFPFLLIYHTHIALGGGTHTYRQANNLQIAWLLRCFDLFLNARLKLFLCCFVFFSDCCGWEKVNELFFVVHFVFIRWEHSCSSSFLLMLFVVCPSFLFCFPCLLLGFYDWVILISNVCLLCLAGLCILFLFLSELPLFSFFLSFSSFISNVFSSKRSLSPMHFLLSRPLPPLLFFSLFRASCFVFVVAACNQ